MSKIKIDRKQVTSVFEHYKNEEAILLTEDGNIFLASNVGKNLCRDHCARINMKFATLTRKNFESGIEEILPDGSTIVAEIDAPKVTDDSSKSEDAWKQNKFSEIVEYAKAQGLDPQTKTNQGKKVLIAEIEAALLAAAAGESDTTNHKS